MQTGIDRYVNIKRKMSPKEKVVPLNMKFTKPNVPTQDGNRFKILGNLADSEKEETTIKNHLDLHQFICASSAAAAL